MVFNYPPQLPIVARKDDIIQAIRQHQIIVIAGDTGSGKTTQLPKMCLDAGQGDKGIIGCTQPRRIAAISVAERVEEELAATGLVGYKIRFHDHTHPETKIKFMTDGILLAETRGDRRLSRYDTIIIDEAHERSLNIDFLLGYLHKLLKERRDLKMIISSATIDTEKFSHHFADAPIIEVSGRTYPVSFHYLPPPLDGNDNRQKDAEKEKNIVELAVDKVVDLADCAGGGDILVFMPTERDILDTVRLIEKKLVNPALVLPLFGRLQGADQRRIFKQSGLRKIIVATNVAETSITVPGIRTVIDTGVARIARYNVRAGTTSLPVTRVSRASCDQRAGRCGRTGSGTCFRLYSEEDYLARSRFTLPEILRSNLAEVILQMISLRLGDPRSFPFLEPPAPRAINDGYRILRELGATTPDNRLTDRGRIMASLPLDPRISRMIIEGAELGVLREVTIIAAVLAIQDPRLRPLDKAEQARQAQSCFIQPGSDFLTFVNIWDSCKGAMQGKHPSAGLRKFCKNYFISWQRMREWFDIHDQIQRIIKQHREISTGKADSRNKTRQGKDVDNKGKSVATAAVHQALTAGFLRNIGMKKQKNSYQISGNREVVLFPGSGLYNRGGQWIVAADFIHTSQLFARVVANIEVSWLERLGGELCKRSWSDPHWQKKAAQVMALEKVSLFGLVLIAGRRVNYGRINKKTGQEAREIFIRDALIGGELSGNYPFLQHNLDLSRRFSEMEERLRKRTILTDDQVLYDFYDQRLGLVYDRFTLNRFLSKKENKGKKKFLWMDEEDVCQTVPDSDELYRFPETLETSQGALRLHYRFQPGHEEDGMTVDIPVSCYPALSPTSFEWLVPGLLDEKIFFILKGLPKRLRRLLVPLPDAVDRIMDGMESRRGSLYPALEQVILRCFQITIIRSDWQIDAMPLHLRMRYRLCDEGGKTLHCSRNYQELDQYCVRPDRPPAGVARSVDRRTDTGTTSVKKGNNKEWRKEVTGIISWDFVNPPCPEPVLDRQNRIIGMYYPALEINDTGPDRSVTLRYIEDYNQAGQANRAGLRFLYGLQFSRELKAIRKECKAAVAGHTASWMSLGLKATAGELKILLFHAVLDGLFDTGLPLTTLPSKEEADTVINTLKEEGITGQARSLLNKVLDLLAVRRQTMTVLNRSRDRAAQNKSLAADRYEEYRQLLVQLLPPDFLTGNICSEQLLDTKRYLQALANRIERAEHAPHKDIRKAERMQPVLDKLRQLDSQIQKKYGSGQNQSTACVEEITTYRRMVEEYRVSIFSPETGTAMPVSEKRLEQQWLNILNSCHSME